MIIDTGAFLAEGIKPIDPDRLAFALRTLARVLEIARPALERAPMPWRLVAGVAVDAVVDIANAYADKLDADGKHPDVHGWRTDKPDRDGWYLGTLCKSDGSCGSVYIFKWEDGSWDKSVISEWHRVVAWQPLPPPYRGES